jgi:hypothetical protein
MREMPRASRVAALIEPEPHALEEAEEVVGALEPSVGPTATGAVEVEDLGRPPDDVGRDPVEPGSGSVSHMRANRPRCSFALASSWAGVEAAGLLQHVPG